MKWAVRAPTYAQVEVLYARVMNCFKCVPLIAVVCISDIMILLSALLMSRATLLVVVLLEFQRDRAAALATSCRVEIKNNAGFHDLVQNEALGTSYRTVCK